MKLLKLIIHKEIKIILYKIYVSKITVYYLMYTGRRSIFPPFKQNIYKYKIVELHVLNNDSL